MRSRPVPTFVVALASMTLATQIHSVIAQQPPDLAAVGATARTELQATSTPGAAVAVVSGGRALINAQPASTLSPQIAAAASVAFTHVNVVDVERGRVLRDHSVLIAGNRIEAVGPTTKVQVPAGARLVNGRGKYLIPGLWEMHAHVASNEEGDEAVSFPLFVANGVTGIRDMGGVSTRWRAWRGAPAAGAPPRPRVIVGRQVEGLHPSRPSFAVMVRDRIEAEAAVDFLADRGADFIKVKEYLSRDAYLAIAERAKIRGVPFAGHVPVAVTAQEASASGQRTFEHLNGGGSHFLLFASRDEPALRAELVALAEDPDETNASLNLRFQRATWLNRLLHGFDQKKLDALSAVMARNNTYLTPTLAVQRSMESELRARTRRPIRWLGPDDGRQRAESCSHCDAPVFRC